MHEEPVPDLQTGRQHRHQQATEAGQEIQRPNGGLLRVFALVQGWGMRDQPHRR